MIASCTPKRSNKANKDGNNLVHKAVIIHSTQQLYDYVQSVTSQGQEIGIRCLHSSIVSGYEHVLELYNQTQPMCVPKLYICESDTHKYQIIDNIYRLLNPNYSSAQRTLTRISVNMKETKNLHPGSTYYYEYYLDSVLFAQSTKKTLFSDTDSMSSFFSSKMGKSSKDKDDDHAHENSPQVHKRMHPQNQYTQVPHGMHGAPMSPTSNRPHPSSLTLNSDEDECTSISWSDTYIFDHLPEFKTLKIKCYEIKRKRSKPQLLGVHKFNFEELLERPNIDEWVPLELKDSSYFLLGGSSKSSYSKNSSLSSANSSSDLGEAHSSYSPKRTSHNNNNDPTSRLSIKTEHVLILPLDKYRIFSEFLNFEFFNICKILEMKISTGDKHNLGKFFLRYFISIGKVNEYLTELVFHEVEKHQDNHILILRQNSLASKSVEHYLRLVGIKFMEISLYDVVYDICEHPDSRIWEVDPDRLLSSSSSGITSTTTNENSNGMVPDQNDAELKKNQQYFIALQNSCLNGVTSAGQLFPAELAKLFSIWKKRCLKQNIGHLFPRLVSSSLFLRLICPAILSPTLFGLRQELPDTFAGRILTLTAKVMLNLANGQKFSHKEPYMEFMNAYINQNTEKMENFIHSIAKKPISVNLKTDVYVDTGLELAFLHEKLEQIMKNPMLVNDEKFKASISPMENILMDLSERKKNRDSTRSEPDKVIDTWYREAKAGDKAVTTSGLVNIFSSYTDCRQENNKENEEDRDSATLSDNSSDERESNNRRNQNQTKTNNNNGNDFSISANSPSPFFYKTKVEKENEPPDLPPKKEDVRLNNRSLNPTCTTTTSIKTLANNLLINNNGDHGLENTNQNTQKTRTNDKDDYLQVADLDYDLQEKMTIRDKLFGCAALQKTFTTKQGNIKRQALARQRSLDLLDLQVSRATDANINSKYSNSGQNHIREINSNQINQKLKTKNINDLPLGGSIMINNSRNTFRSNETNNLNNTNHNSDSLNAYTANTTNLIHLKHLEQLINRGTDAENDKDSEEMAKIYGQLEIRKFSED